MTQLVARRLLQPPCETAKPGSKGLSRIHYHRAESGRPSRERIDEIKIAEFREGYRRFGIVGDVSFLFIKMADRFLNLVFQGGGVCGVAYAGALQAVPPTFKLH